MFCVNCGREFEGRFCPDCGTPVADSQSNRPEGSHTGLEMERIEAVKILRKRYGKLAKNLNEVYCNLAIAKELKEKKKPSYKDKSKSAVRRFLSFNSVNVAKWMMTKKKASDYEAIAEEYEQKAESIVK